MKGALTALYALTLYTVSDILVWQRIFEANELWQYDKAYHIGWHITLCGYLLAGLMHKDIRDKIMHFVCLLVFSQNGTEDVFYYWFDFRAIPDRLHWLDNSAWIYFSPVTRTNLIVNVVLWIFPLIVLFGLMYRDEKIWRPPPQ